MKPDAQFPITIGQETVQIGTAAELTVALDVLQGHYDHDILVQLQPYLAPIIPTAKDLLAVMKSISADDQVFLIQSLGSNLVGILQDASHLRDLLATLAEVEVETAILNTLSTRGLNSLVLTAGELAEVLEWVYGQTDELALDLLGWERIRDLCREAADLGAIIRCLSPGLQTRLVEYLGWDFCLGLIRDGRDLAILLRALPASTSTRLLDYYDRPQLVKLIGNPVDWTYLYQRLEPAEAEFITQRLGMQFPPRKN
jgi:hypothetical protein